LHTINCIRRIGKTPKVAPLSFLPALIHAETQIHSTLDHLLSIGLVTLSVLAYSQKVSSKNFASRSALVIRPVNPTFTILVSSDLTNLLFLKHVTKLRDLYR